MSRCLTTAAAVTIAGAQRATTGETSGAPPLCVFSKHLQFLDYSSLARTCRELGLDGVDLTVRQGGHVHPERVDRELREAVTAMRAEGLEVPMITTTFKSGEMNIYVRYWRQPNSAESLIFVSGDTNMGQVIL